MQVLTAVRQQSMRASRAQLELQKAQADITAVSNEIGVIEKKAEDTEGNVEVICKDIRSMDYAKRHLTTSISALENFGTLTDAVAHLEATALQRCGTTFKICMGYFDHIDIMRDNKSD